VLTGLRGTGKTVLLETFRAQAIDAGWGWVGADLSEAASLSEERLATRLLTDLAVLTSSAVVGREEWSGMGFRPDQHARDVPLDFDALAALYGQTPGLASDKLKAVLEFAWPHIAGAGRKGVVFAYDEAQNLADHAAKNEYPLSLLLDVFQSLQRKNVPFLLALAGLPTLFPKLVESRTFAERMFRVVFLDRLTDADSREAVVKPIEASRCPELSLTMVSLIVSQSGGYPYFIQFIAREIVDLLFQAHEGGGPTAAIPLGAVIRKLDTDFFAGRWSRATDRQRELLIVIAGIEGCDQEFTVQEVVAASARAGGRPFRSSRVSQLLAALCEAGLVYRNRHGKYSFAVPLLGRFIAREQTRSRLDDAARHRPPLSPPQDDKPR
jgi:hypothetical protein